MTKETKMRLIPALLAVAFSGASHGAGFQLLEQNASGIGNAYAGSAAVAENASTIFYNPAGMTQLQSREVSGGLTAIGTSFKFSNSGSSVGALGAAGNGGDGGGWGAVPNGYLSWSVSKDLYLGLGIGAPFGMMTQYDNPWIGGAQSLKFDIKTININPSVAYRVNDALSFGAGVNWQKLNVEYQRLAAVTSAALAATKVTLKLDDDTWGWNAGALLKVTPATKVGLAYRSTMKYTVDGDIKVSGPMAGLAPTLSDRNAKADIKLPDTWILSATHALNDRVELLGDISWTGWSSIPKVDIVNSSGALAGTTAQTLDTKFRDTWRAALGVTYKYNEAWKLKAGVAYDQTPTRDASTRLVSMPDNDRKWLSLGAQWKLSKDSALDFGVAHLFVKDASINNNQTLTGRGTVSGTYQDSAWLVGAQFSMAF